jgi:Ribosomal protein S13
MSKVVKKNLLSLNLNNYFDNLTTLKLKKTLLLNGASYFCKLRGLLGLNSDVKKIINLPYLLLQNAAFLKQFFIFLKAERNKNVAYITEYWMFLKNNKFYKGLRYSKGLPVRGQRTHTNSKTARKLNFLNE